jgi:nitrogen fixation NifU-like protein
MDSEFRDLYQEIILDHNRSPRNFGKMGNATHALDGQNPVCGDHYKIYLRVENGIIEDVRFDGAGCAISKASASVMTSMIKGKTIEEADRYFELFHKIITGEIDPMEHLEELGKLAAFAGVAEFPIRVKCATLAWHTMRNALHGVNEMTSTEEDE